MNRQTNRHTHVIDGQTDWSIPLYPTSTKYLFCRGIMIYEKVGWLYWGCIMAVGDAYVFPGSVTSVLTQLFLPKPTTTFLTCFCRGERRK